MTAKLDAVIFDLGDVLINIDPEQGWQHLHGLMLNERGEPLTIKEIERKIWAPIIVNGEPSFAYSLGHQTTDDYLDIVHQRAGGKVSKELLRTACTDMFSPLPERWTLFHDMVAKDEPKIAMLSDTCEIDIQAIESSMPGLFAPLHKDRRFYSYNIHHLKKLGPEAFLFVCNSLHVAPSRTLLVDDRPINKIGVDKAGGHFLHLTKDQDARQRLRQEYNLNV